MSRGGGHLNTCPGGLEGKLIQGGRGGGGCVEQKQKLVQGGIYKSVPGRWRYTISFSRGAFIYIVPGGGGGGWGGTLAIIVICRGVRLNNGIAHSTNNMSLYNCCMDHMQSFHSCDVCIYGHVCAAINTAWSITCHTHTMTHNTLKGGGVMIITMATKHCSP